MINLKVMKLNEKSFLDNYRFLDNFRSMEVI